MGSDTLILDEWLASEVGVDLALSDVHRVEGSDETGHRCTRHFRQLAGAIRASEVPAVAQAIPS